MKKILRILKRILNPSWDSPRKRNRLNILTTFGDFKPHGNQSYESFVPLLIKNINEVIPTIAKVAEFEYKNILLTPTNFYEINKNKNSKEIEKKLIENLNFRGSDKVALGYHIIYSCLFENTTGQYKILEIGLGTNNPKIVSSMGLKGKPGASIKAFRDTFANSLIYGADIDKNILFSEERIETFFVDQNNLDTFKNITENIEEKFDLIIDDGLHYQLSNLNTLLFSLSNLKNGGFFVIEDIGIWTIDTWKIVNKLIPDNFESNIIQMSERNFIFLVKKIS